MPLRRSRYFRANSLIAVATPEEPECLGVRLLPKQHMRALMPLGTGCINETSLASKHQSAKSGNQRVTLDLVAAERFEPAVRTAYESSVESCSREELFYFVDSVIFGCEQILKERRTFSCLFNSLCSELNGSQVMTAQDSRVEAWMRLIEN